MNLKQETQLQIACELLRKQIKKSAVDEESVNKWKEMALRGSVQSRRNQKTLVRR